MARDSETSEKKCLIVGAGPAGLASAIFFARAGWKVTLIDKKKQIEQKICGECLSPPSRQFLIDLGVWDLIPKEKILTLDGITLISPAGERCPLDFGEESPFTIPRPVLDQSLCDLAVSMGVIIRFGIAAVRVEYLKDKYKIEGSDHQTYTVDLLIGCDGRNSWVAKQLDLARSQKHGLLRTAIMGHFESPNPFLRGVEMHVASWGYVGLNPLPCGRVNVIAVLSPEDLRQRLKGKGTEGLIQFLVEHTTGVYAPPLLRKRMKGTGPASNQTWTTSSIAWKPKRIVGTSCALVGDSAGFTDPFTGEGLYHSLASSRQLVVEVIAHGIEKGLKKYERWHQKNFDPEEKFCLLLQKFLPYSKIADYTIRQLGQKPKLRRVLAEAIADRLPMQKVLSPWFWGRVLMPWGNQEHTR